MLTQVEVTKNLNSTLVLPLGDISAGYVVKDIDGLDPVKATIVSSSFAKKDGTQYQSSRREARNILITLGLSGGYGKTVRELRHNLYKFLMPKTEVKLRFIDDDDQPVDIRGRIESFDSALFTQTPSVVISISCFDPDFYALTSSTISNITDWVGTPNLIQYEGSVETGILFRMNINRNLAGFELQNMPADGVMQTWTYGSPGPTLFSGDVIEICTVPGEKRVKRTRAGSTISVLYGMSPFSDWLTLEPGLNDFRVQADMMEGYPGFSYTIEYLTKFGGL